MMAVGVGDCLAREAATGQIQQRNVQPREKMMCMRCANRSMDIPDEAFIRSQTTTHADHFHANGTWQRISRMMTLGGRIIIGSGHNSLVGEEGFDGFHENCPHLGAYSFQMGCRRGQAGGMKACRFQGRPMRL